MSPENATSCTLDVSNGKGGSLEAEAETRSGCHAKHWRFHHNGLRPMLFPVSEVGTSWMPDTGQLNRPCRAIRRKELSALGASIQKSSWVHFCWRHVTTIAVMKRLSSVKVRTALMIVALSAWVTLSWESLVTPVLHSDDLPSDNWPLGFITPASMNTRVKLDTLCMICSDWSAAGHRRTVGLLDLP